MTIPDCPFPEAPHSPLHLRSAGSPVRLHPEPPPTEKDRPHTSNVTRLLSPALCTLRRPSCNIFSLGSSPTTFDCGPPAPDSACATATEGPEWVWVVGGATPS